MVTLCTNFKAVSKDYHFVYNVRTYVHMLYKASVLLNLMINDCFMITYSKELTNKTTLVICSIKH